MPIIPPSAGAGVADEILIIIITILFFFSVPQIPIIKKYFEQSPYVILGVALLLLIFRKQITSAIKGR